MNPEENDELWELLGRARQTPASPFFSRDILRQVRETRQERSGWAGWLDRNWRLAAVSACAACLTVGIFVTEQRMTQKGQERQEIIAMAKRVSASPDYQVINDLDELLAVEKDSVWLKGNAE